MSSSSVITAAPLALTATDFWKHETSAVPSAASLHPPPDVLSIITGGARFSGSLLDLLQPRQTSHFVSEPERTANQPVEGYANSSKTTAGTSTKGEWGFLNDSHMSIEDKLFQFIKLVQKKSDDELEKKMKEYRDKYCKSSTKSNDSGGILGFLGGVFSGGWLVDALKEVGSLLGKAGATALGLAPFGSAFALAGKELAGLVSDALGLKKTSSSSTTERGEAGSPDERLDMLEIQRLADKQKQMFECVSNVLRVVHETAMAAVGNIR